MSAGIAGTFSVTAYLTNEEHIALDRLTARAGAGGGVTRNEMVRALIRDASRRDLPAVDLAEMVAGHRT